MSFVVVKCYCQFVMTLLDLLNDTFVDDELIDCAQYAFYSCKLSFVPYLFTAVCSLMYFTTRSVKILYDVLRHAIEL